MRYVRLAILFVPLALVASARAAEPGPMRLTYDGTKAATITHAGDEWTLRLDTERYTFAKAADGLWRLRHNDDVLATGKQSGTRLTLSTPKETFLSLELKADKVQVSRGAEAAAIELKTKAGEIKVYQGTTELGKVKYYAGEKKAKAKRLSGEEVAVLRGIGKPTAAPAAFLLPAMTPADTAVPRLPLCLVLLALDR